MWIIAAFAVFFLLRSSVPFAANVTSILKNVGLVTEQPSWFAHPAASVAAAKSAQVAQANLSAVGGPVATNSNATVQGGTSGVGSPATSPAPAVTTPAAPSPSRYVSPKSYPAVP